MQVRVAQWNVWYREHADNILRVLRDIGADIICLQELTVKSEVNPKRNIPEEINAIGYSGYFQPTLENTSIILGNGIFSRFPIVKKRSVYVQRESDNREADDKENRVYIETQLAVKDKILTVGNAHLSWSKGFTDSPGKERETELLLPLLDEHGSNYIFCCDANALPDSDRIKSIATTLDNAGPAFDMPTWSTKRHEFSDFTIDSLDWRLDYIFKSPDVIVTDSRIIQTEFSDHLPILVTIEL